MNLVSCILVFFVVPALAGVAVAGEPTGQPEPAAGIFDQLSPDMNNVFDWVFGETEDQEQELNEHFGYLRGGAAINTEAGSDLGRMATELGIKPEFFNFKAHDYDGNDKIDGLELLAMMVHERLDGHHHQQQRLNSNHQSNQNSNIPRSDYIQKCSTIIDRLFQEDDLNYDGFLDFHEYSQARSRMMAAVNSS